MADNACARIVAYDNGRDEFRAVAGAFFENPTARLRVRDTGADRPTRMFDSCGCGRHVIAPRGDWRQRNRIAFAEAIVSFVESAARDRKFDHIMFVAPPAMLGPLRRVLGRVSLACEVAGIGKDLIKVPAAKLQVQLRRAIRSQQGLRPM